MGEEVIELSIDETNSLRASLGLKPLRVDQPTPAATVAATSSEPGHTTDNNSSNSNNNSQEELNLSVDESNDLRARLGLKPLNVSSKSSSSGASGRKASEAIHAPAQNTREQDAIAKRLEQAKLKREVEAGISKIRKESGLSSLGDQDGGGGGGGVLSWADQMRKKSITTTATTTANASMGKEKKSTKTKKDKLQQYTDSDFENQNLTVSHAMADFDAGATTVLTLADKSILEAEEDNEHTLENVNLSESATVRDNLKRKRMMEMGVGHAGGYTGYDDDEFEELGGSQMTLGGGIQGKGGKGTVGSGNDEEKKKKLGFKLGTDMKEVNDDSGGGSSLFAAMSGKSISLVSGNNESVHQADFLSYEEDEAMELGIGSMSKEQIEKKRKKKEKKMKKKLKKDRKKDRKLRGEGEREPVFEESNESSAEVNNAKPLLEDLLSDPSNHKRRKRQRRRRQRDSDTEGSDDETSQMKSGGRTDEDIAESKVQDEDEVTQKERKKKFDSIMEKANQRTQNTFGEKSYLLDKSKKTAPSIPEEDEPDDDAFLSAALSKARRLRRLKDLSAKASNGGNLSMKSDAKGANAVLEALKRSQQKSLENNAAPNGEGEGKKITFELGTTTEFTRALRAQPSREKDTNRKNADEKSVLQKDTPSDNRSLVNPKEEDVTMTEDLPENDEDNAETLEDLAHHIEEEKDDLGAFGSTGSTVGVGRGLSAFLGMLKQTGEISGKTGGKEEMRGRAKDERTYEDYTPLDLKQVVKIDTTGLNGTPHDKDIELANREVKLEYRDEHGRLLTRKEAYRQLCYQFHGHGSSKKKEEKRLQQIEREQAERSMSGRSSSGTLGLQKATQKATGKAFIVRRT